MCWQYLTTAMDKCSSAAAADPAAVDTDYDREERRFHEWVGKVVELKARLGGALLGGGQSLMYRLESLDCLSELVRLDDIPVDANPTWRDAVAQPYFAPEDFDEIQTRIRKVCKRLISGAVVAATASPDDPQAHLAHGAGGPVPEDREKSGSNILYLSPAASGSTSRTSWLRDSIPETLLTVFQDAEASKDALASAVRTIEKLADRVAMSSGPVCHPHRCCPAPELTAPGR